MTDENAPLTINPAPITSDPRLIVPACRTLRQLIVSNRIVKARRRERGRERMRKVMKRRRERERGDETYNKWNLQQRTQLILILNTSLGMNQRSLIRDPTITPHEHIIRHSLSKHLDLQHVCDDFFRFAINVRVHERDVVVAGDDVAEGGESFFDSLERDGGGEGVSEVLEFLICRRGRYEQSMSIS